MVGDRYLEPNRGKESCQGEDEHRQEEKESDKVTAASLDKKEYRNVRSLSHHSVKTRVALSLNTLTDTQRIESLVFNFCPV